MKKIIIGIGILIVCLSFASAITWKSNGTETMMLGDSGNLNVSGNITTSDTGFFGWLGTLTNRISGLFVQDINMNGTFNLSGDLIVNNSVFFVNSTSGNVGVGTIIPSSKLEVYGGNITLGNSTASELNYIKFGRGGYMYDDGTYTIIGHW